MHHLGFAILCLLWGSNFYLMKLAVASFGPITVGAARVTFGSLVVAIVFLARKQSWPVRWSHVGYLIIVVLLSYIYPYTIQPYLIAESKSSAFVGMMVSPVPLLTIIVSVPMLGIRPTLAQMFGVLGGLVCFALVFYEGAAIRNLSPAQLALAAGVPLGYAIANTYIKKYLHDLPALALTLVSLAMGTLVLLPVGLAVEPVKPEGDLGKAITAAIVIGTLGTGVATVIFYQLIRDRGPLFAGMVTYVIPVVALAFGAADREQLTVLQIGALAGIFAMLAVVQISSRRPLKPVDTATQA